MADWSDPRATAAPFPASAGARDAAYDAGLRSYMLSVYNYMASGVLLTGIVALLFSRGGAESPAATIIMSGGLLAWIIMLAPLGFVMVLSFGINRLSTGAAQALFWAFAAVMGLSMSTIFLRFTGESIATTFFATTAAFAGLSLFGYTTKKDLSGFGTFLIMGVVGILVASIVNIFLQSSVMSLVISIVGVLLFAGLTAYDTQRIKSMYSYVAGTDMMGKTVIMGALSLYLDFVNMFTFLLNLMGSRD
jgi:FtsH-binding integral membrane protein